MIFGGLGVATTPADMASRPSIRTLADNMVDRVREKNLSVSEASCQLFRLIICHIVGFIGAS